MLHGGKRIATMLTVLSIISQWTPISVIPAIAASTNLSVVEDTTLITEKSIPIKVMAKTKVIGEDGRESVEEVAVPNAEVNLYIGTERRGYGKTNEEGMIYLSTQGMTAGDLCKASISAKKTLSTSTAIDGTARDDLFTYNIGSDGYHKINWNKFYLTVDTVYCSNPNHKYLCGQVVNYKVFVLYTYRTAEHENPEQFCELYHGTHFGHYRSFF